MSGDLGTFMSRVDAEPQALKVRTNADTPDDAAVARENGAEGIGLVRTEHMFFDWRAHPHRAAHDHGGRQEASAKPSGGGASVSARGLRGHLRRDGRMFP